MEHTRSSGQLIRLLPNVTYCGTKNYHVITGGKIDNDVREETAAFDIITVGVDVGSVCSSGEISSLNELSARTVVAEKIRPRLPLLVRIYGIVRLRATRSGYSARITIIARALSRTRCVVYIFSPSTTTFARKH